MNDYYSLRTDGRYFNVPLIPSANKMRTIARMRQLRDTRRASHTYRANLFIAIVRGGLVPGEEDFRDRLRPLHSPTSKCLGSHRRVRGLVPEWLRDWST